MANSSTVSGNIFLVSTSYSLLSTKLFINGTATGTNQNGDMPVILVPESGTVSIQLRNLKFNSLTTSATCKIQVTYQMNGQNIEFYIQLNFTK